MTDIQRLKRKITKFNNAYKIYVNNYSETDLTKTVINLKNVYYAYRRFLQDMVKNADHTIFLPTLIIRRAQELNIINDADIWINFIYDFNLLIYETDADKIRELEIHILNKYTNPLKNVNELLNKYYNNLGNEPCYEEIELSDKQHEYRPNDFGIDYYTYHCLVSYFKQHTEIQRVWLYGSRAQNKALPHSDIDLLIESPAESFEKIEQGIMNLRIPNYIDAKNTNIVHQNIDDFSYAKVTQSRPILIYSCL